MIDSTFYEELLAVTASQKEVIDSLAQHGDLYEYTKLIKPQEKEEILNQLHEKNLDVDSYFDFIFFKRSRLSNSIKLHIPLNNYNKDGIFIANLIYKKIEKIAGIKLTFPNDAHINSSEPDIIRVTQQAPITIYLHNPESRKNSSKITSDDKLRNIEEIANIIHQIDILLDEVQDLYGEITLSDSIADGDQMIGKYTALTIDRDDRYNYIDALGVYREISKGIYEEVGEGDYLLSGAQVRNELMRTSPKLRYLNQMLPYVEVFNDLHEYINSNELMIESRNLSEEETKSEPAKPSFFKPDEVTPGENVLNVMRTIIGANKSIRALEKLKENPQIRENSHLMTILDKFENKYNELHSIEDANSERVSLRR